MTQNLYWKNYWKEQTCGLHRSQEEAFLAKEADEKLFHLKGGDSLLDFGCGSADLLAYYSQIYKRSVGVDSSELMLEKAKERLLNFKTDHQVSLINSDDVHVWDQIEERFREGCKFDRITAGQVIQYLDQKQVDDFIGNAQRYLSADGFICLFDVVDTRLFELWDAKFFNNKAFNFNVLLRIVLGRCRRIMNKFRKVPELRLGYTYSPSFFELLAKKYGLKLDVVHSMYYEYRYHVILRS